MGSVSNIKTCVTQIGAVASDLNFFVFRAPERCHIDSVHLTVGTTLTASDSNYSTYTLRNLYDDGTGTVSVATRSNNVAGLVITADIPAAMVMSTTASAHELDEGDVLQLMCNVDVAGTSHPDAEFACIVNWSPGTGTGQ